MSVSIVCCGVSQLFSQEPLTCSSGETTAGQLAIPEYQRPYWTKNKIDSHFEEVLSIFDEHYSDKE